VFQDEKILEDIRIHIMSTPLSASQRGDGGELIMSGYGMRVSIYESKKSSEESPVKPNARSTTCVKKRVLFRNTLL
jgi:hypothetical protein